MILKIRNYRELLKIIVTWLRITIPLAKHANHPESHPSLLRVLTPTHISFFYLWHRNAALVLYLIALASFLLLETSCHNEKAVSNTGSTPLNLGQIVQKNLSTNEKHFYHISLDAKYYVRATFSQIGINLCATLYGTSGDKIADFVAGDNASATLSLLTETSGSYKLELHLLDIGATTGSYELKIEEARPFTLRDEPRIAAELAVAEGNSLWVEGTAESFRKAIGRYEAAASYWRAIGEKKEEAIALQRIGKSYHLLGRSKESPEYYERALQLSNEANNYEAEAEIQNAFSEVYVRLDRHQDALDHATSALNLSQKGGYKRSEAQAFNNLGEAYYSFGLRQQSLEYNQKAMSLWQQLRDLQGQAQTLLNLGYVYSDLSETKKASESYEQALSIWRTVSSRRGQAQTLVAIAHLYSKLGVKQEALLLYDQSLPILRAIGDRFWEASVCLGKAYVYKSFGRTDSSLFYYDQALTIFKDIGSQVNEADTLVMIGKAYALSGDQPKAMINFQSALLVGRDLADMKLESLAERHIGETYTAMGNEKLALLHLNRALSLYRISKFPRGEAETLTSIGNTYSGLGKKWKALLYFNRALRLNRSTGDRFAETRTLYQMARVELDSGHLVNVNLHLEAALNIAESLRTSIASNDLRASYFASIRQYFEFHIDLLMGKNKRLPRGGFDISAFEQSERARARSLLEQLIETRADILRQGDTVLVARLRNLQQQINNKATLKLHFLNTGIPGEEVLSITKEITSLIMEREQVEAQIRSSRPQAQPQPSSLKEIQQLLDDDTLLLEYALGSECSYLWAVTRNGLTSYSLPSRSKIEQVARAIYELSSPPESSPILSEQQREVEYQRQAIFLSEMILNPVATQLGNKRLLVVADGVLQYIPFSALPIPRNGSRGGSQARNSQFVPLIVEHEIVNLPSASTLAVLRRETSGRQLAPKAVAVIADPVFETDDMRVLAATGKVKSGGSANQVAANLSLLRSRRGGNFARLPATQNEARAIEEFTSPADRLIAKGFDANRAQAISSALSQYRIIHFATHGILDRDNPELSAIVLSLVDRQGNTQDGYLRLHDIYNLNLPAELVVLSACDSGLGKEFKGEGLVGLTRGFMYAGALRVMASLWKVEDEPTAKLMKLFYQGMLKDKLSAAAALRRAQIALWQDAQWHAPYFWAAFTLQGEWK